MSERDTLRRAPVPAPGGRSTLGKQLTGVCLVRVSVFSRFPLLSLWVSGVGGSDRITFPPLSLTCVDETWSLRSSDSCRQTQGEFVRLGTGLKSLRPTDNETLQHIGIVAKCKILGFLENAIQDTSNIVGQFGVGLYSTFVEAGNVEVFTKTYDATKGSQSCPTHVANVAKPLGVSVDSSSSSPDKRQSYRHPLRGSRRRHTLCLIHLPPVLLLCVFGSTFQSLVVVAVSASKSFAVRRSSKLSRHSCTQERLFSSRSARYAPSSPVLAFRHVYTYVDVTYTGCVRPVSSVSTSPGSSSSVGSRDLSWESALRALPPPLLAALRAELLDDPGVLTTDEKLESGVAPSGAASSGQRTTPSLDLTSTTLLGTGVAAASTTTASLVGNVGTDPKTGCSGLGSTKGTDPKTGLSPVGMHVDVVGGDPRTDNASLLCENQTSEGMAATCPPYRPGAVALQTANPDSSALSPDPCL